MKFFLFLLTAAAIYSCGGNTPSPNTSATTETPVDTISILREAVANSMGIEASKVTYADSFFTIDGDGLVSLPDAILRHSGVLNGEVQSQSSESNQLLSPYKINTNKYKSVVLYADPTVPAVWLAALDSAIAHHNATESSLSYSRTSTTTGSTTRVTMDTMGSTIIASAAYPDYYGRPGSKIAINPLHNDMEESKKIFAITHEICHTIGMSHTNGTYGTLVTGTPISDPASVMNGAVRYWTGFSHYDKEAIKKVYPKYSL